MSHTTTFLTGIIPNNVYEKVEDMGECLSVKCIYPNKQKVLGFALMYEKIKERYLGRVLPVYQLVEKGSTTSWFTVFLRK